MQSTTEVRETNISLWENIYGSGHKMTYPNETLIRMGHYVLKSHANKCRVLDYGFGSGENLIHFAKQGHSMAGVEVSSSALETASGRILEAGQTADLQLLQNSKIPFENESFDVVIAWEVLSYNNWESYAEAYKEILRVLKPGGTVIATVTAPGHWQHTHSESLGDGLYRIHTGAQTGATIIVIPETELHRCFQGQRLSIGYLNWKIESLVIATWLVSFTKYK